MIPPYTELKEEYQENPGDILLIVGIDIGVILLILISLFSIVTVNTVGLGISIFGGLLLVIWVVVGPGFFEGYVTEWLNEKLRNNDEKRNSEG